ncbi:MAG: iron-sulfur cluster assembly scaffold protein [Planctomycetota bacterium]|jgi:NifU-like protein involved in Fe-S cluster formation|nr:iron-sulfur cluster assembly scaffold protein [Planctomycetota bacterium]
MVSTMTAPILEASMSDQARQRLRKPLRRGSFRPLDAARAEFGLLTVADTQGQARIYWLIDLNTQVVEDARFLAFGSLASHPIADCWTEQLRGQSVEAVCHMAAADIEAALRDKSGTPAFGEAGLEPLNFISELQALALAALPSVKLLPKPVEVERYQRKREQDWDEQDRVWLPLSLMKKIMQVQDLAGKALSERLNRSDIAWSVEGLHDDFAVVVKFGGTGWMPPEDEQPTLVLFIQSALQNAIHPAITVSVKS